MISESSNLANINLETNGQTEVKTKLFFVGGSYNRLQWFHIIISYAFSLGSLSGLSIQRNARNVRNVTK